MQNIDLDAMNWENIEDFYRALLAALGAPVGHGLDINALIDSVIGGDMNAVQPPFTIVIHNAGSLDRNVSDHILLAKKYLAKARLETRSIFGNDVDASIEIVS